MPSENTDITEIEIPTALERMAVTATNDGRVHQAQVLADAAALIERQQQRIIALAREVAGLG